MKLHRTLPGLITAVVLMAPGPVAAATFKIDLPSFSSLSSSTVPNPVVLPGMLPAFDGSLGSLTGVSIETIGLGSAFLTLDVDQAGFFSGPLNVSTALLDAGAGVLASSGAQTIGTIRGTAAGAGPLLLQDGNSWVSVLDITTGLDAFLSAASYDLQVLFSGTVSGPGLPSQPYVADEYSGSVLVSSVTYTYTPVPEPGSALLVGLGLLVLARRPPRNRRSR